MIEVKEGQSCFTDPMTLIIEAIGQQMPKAIQCAVMNLGAMSMDYREGPCLNQALELVWGC